MQPATGGEGNYEAIALSCKNAATSLYAMAITYSCDSGAFNILPQSTCPAEAVQARTAGDRWIGIAVSPDDCLRS